MHSFKKILFLLIPILLVGAVLFFGYKYYNQKRQEKAEAKQVEKLESKGLTESDSNNVISDAVITKEKENKQEEQKEKTKEEPPSDACMKNQPADFDCYMGYYQGLVRVSGSSVAFKDLRKRYESDSYVVAQCHQLTHIIGRTVALRYNDVALAYQEGDNFCWSGFYHGVMETVAQKLGPKKIVGQINTICANVPGKDKYSFEYFNCVHGLGHGLMAISDNELPKSLSDCEKLVGSWEQSSCYGGVFMENVMADNREHVTKYLDPKRPLYPCDSIDDKYQSDCYLMQTSYMMKVTKSDFPRIFELCVGAGKYKDICWQSLGRDASGSTVSDIQRTHDICELGRSFEQKSNCIVGAVKDFVSYYHGEEKAIALCNSFEEDLKSVCLQTEKEYFVSFK